MAHGVGLKPIDFAWNSMFRNTEVFEIESKAAGVTYVVFVATPPGYDADTKRTYPVIFAPDGNSAVLLMAPSVAAATTLELIRKTGEISLPTASRIQPETRTGSPIGLDEEFIAAITNSRDSGDPKTVPDQRGYQAKQPEKQHHSENNAEQREY